MQQKVSPVAEITAPATLGPPELLNRISEILDNRVPAGFLEFQVADYPAVQIRTGTAVTRGHQIFDIASITKLFTALVTLQTLHAAKLPHSQLVRHILPEFARSGVDQITIAHLLTHTSGLSSGHRLWRLPYDPQQQRRAVLASKPTQELGEYVYSCTGYQIAGFLLERLHQQPLNQIFEQNLFEPLQLRHTILGPVPTHLRPLVAPTEIQYDPPRGLLQGEVHDEKAWALGGVSGNAGIFSTASDLLSLINTVLNSTEPAEPPILAGIAGFAKAHPLTPADLGFGQGLGPRISDGFFMGRHSSTFRMWGHTGFTGTLLIALPQLQLRIALLTNRVHPRRELLDPYPMYRSIVDLILQYTTDISVYPPEVASSAAGSTTA